MREALEIPDSLMLYCGLSIGYADPDAPVNAVVADRAEPADLLHILKD